MFKWYIFADGFRECVKGYSKQEFKVMTHKHGKLVKTILA